MRLAVFGLGYVGSVSAACFAAAGHSVIGVDVDERKLSLVRAGRAPVSEPGLDDMLRAMVEAGRLTATADASAAVRRSDVSFVCVGTPSRRNGSLDTQFLARVLADIGVGLRRHAGHHVVAIRSTVVPGLVQSRLVPILEQTSGRQAGGEFGVCVNPEFLREGSALADFAEPPHTIIGETDTRAGDTLLRAYRHLDAPVYRVRPDEASMIKYASNAFHAVKVAFANEIGALCQPLGADGRQVMEVFCADRHLNVSPRYLRPGFGFGGSCLPKDLRAIVHAARTLDVAAPLIGSVLASNDAHIQRVVDAVLDHGKPRVALLGLSFKAGSDDLRESPFVRLAEALIGKGVPLRIYDPDVAVDRVFGRNQAYIQEHLPHVGELVAADCGKLIAEADLLIVGKPMPEIDRLPSLRRPGQVVVDLIGVPELDGAIRPWSPGGGAALAPVALAGPSGG